MIRRWRFGMILILLGFSGALRAETPSAGAAGARHGTDQVAKSPAATGLDKKPTVTYPPFQNIRSDEDWSVLRTSPRDDPYERIKFIPLNQGATVFLSLGGQLRLRGEEWRNFGFGGAGTRDDAFSLSRLRLHADLWLGTRARIFVEAKSALAAGRRLPGGFRTLDVDSIELQNAHLDLRLGHETGSFTLRLGRQEMQFGKQRLISPLDWSNTRRSFDGVRAIAKTGTWRIDGFWTKYDVIHKYSLNRPGAGGLDLYGLYATGSAGSFGQLDLYWLGRERDRAVWSGVTADDHRQTFGGRFWGRSKTGWDWETEAAYQAGSHGPRDIRALMATGELGYGWPGSQFKPRIAAGVDYASGDDDPADGAVNTFDHILPLGHAYLGYIDFVGRQNIIDWRQEIRLSLQRGWTVTAANHFFWRASQADALYNAGGGVVRPGIQQAPRRVGSETDFTAGHAINRFLRLDVGYCHFFAGPFVRATGPAESMDFLYLSVQTTF